MFYPAARDQSGDLAKSLAPHGVMVVTARVYEMNEVAELDQRIVARLAAGEFGAATFYSRRTAEAFVKRIAPAFGRDVATRLGMLCLVRRGGGTADCGALSCGSASPTIRAKRR